MTTPIPNGFAGDLFFEETLRQFLAFQLKQLSQNAANPGVSFVDDLFSRMGANVRKQVKDFLTTHPNISVEINYPREDIKLPFVAVVNVEESEKSAEAYLGDDGGLMYMGERSVEASSSLTFIPNVYGEALAEPDTRPRATHARQLISIPEACVTRIYIGAQEVNIVMYLYAIIKALVLVNKLDFDKYSGARNLKVSGGDLEQRPELFPTFAFFKVITLSYDMNFDVPVSAVRTIGGVDVSLTSYLKGQ